MAEHIKREDVIAHLRECEGTPPEIAYTYPIFKAIECFVEELPAADVAPVVHGRWVKDGDFLICLNCESEINVKNSLGAENRKNYCSNCGARMDLEV